MDNIPDVLKILLMLAAAFPGYDLRADTIEVYSMALEDIDLKLLKAAALKCISEMKFFPAIAELRQAAAEIAALPKRSGAEAWGDVMEAVRRVGSYKNPEFKDPIVARLVKAIGWRTICMSEDEMADRAHFIKAYEQAQGNHINELRQLPLIEETRAQIQAAGLTAALTAKLSSPLLTAGDKTK